MWHHRTQYKLYMSEPSFHRQENNRWAKGSNWSDTLYCYDSAILAWFTGYATVTTRLQVKEDSYYSSLDLISGFWQIKLRDGISCGIISFCDPVTGLRYRYTVAPFGLANSVAAMTSVVSSIMSHLIAQGIAYCYMDYICLAAPDWDTHIARLETVLKTLDLNNLFPSPRNALLTTPQ
jgi:hypothetical protein